MTTATVSHALSRLGTETGSLAREGHIGRVYVMNAESIAAALDQLGGQTHVVAVAGARSRIVSGTTRPVGRLRCLVGRPRFFDCGAVERTELSLDNGIALIDHELGTDRVMVRTWAPSDGSELDQTLWWHGHSVSARLRQR